MSAMAGRTGTGCRTRGFAATALLVGVALMFVWELLAPRFFRGETLRRETPVLVPED